MENLQPKIGDRVRVRQHTWVVRDVEPHGACRIVTLAGHHSEGQPRVWQMLQPFDDIDVAASASRPRTVSVRAWRRACVALIREHAGAGAIRSAAAAHLDVLPYQLEPALALVGGFGSRMLLADDVGLGKTVQALLCASELRARAPGMRLLVLCPAGLRDQWVEEATTRLSLPLTLMDQPALRRLAARCPADVNPWTVETCVVSSLDYVKRPEVLPSVVSAGWDLVVVDEAHGCCGQSDRREAVSTIARRTPFVLLLSATPHNGDEAAFASLCQLGQLDDDLVIFRRSRLEAGRDAGRRVHTTHATPSGAERRMHAALAALTKALRHEQHEMDRHVWLVLALLHKRALSSPYALAVSAERRLQLLVHGAGTDRSQLLLPWDDPAGELDSADAPPMWDAPGLKDTGQERRLLQQVIDTARHAEGQECKLRRLRRLLRALDEPVIIFTEYRDTLQHVRNQVAPHAALIHGGMSREQRRVALNAFPSAGVLLATDAAGEGLNLQAHCRTVINLELPWNPMRLEQRVGRVDRIGQQRRVHVFHLIARGTGETALLARLSTRLSHAHARVSAPNPLGGRPEWSEAASARLVVLREAPDQAHDQPPMQPPAVPLTRLDAEGRHDAARISLLRSLGAVPARHSHVAEPQSGTLCCRTRRRRLRAALGHRTLRLFRSRIVDAAGRTVATHVSATLATTAGEQRADGERESRGCIESSAERAHWMGASLEAHQRLTAVRLRRARAIAALFTDAEEERQPGLFDTREERHWQQRATERRAGRSAADARVVQLEAAAQVCVTPPELLLVLEPTGARTGRP